MATDFFQGSVDYHSHICPGVDDGIQTLEASLETLAFFEELGIQKAVLTPHVKNDLHTPNALVLERFESLQSAYKGSVDLALAAEYMLDAGFHEHLENYGRRELLPEAILVETSYLSPPNNLDDLLFDILSDGITPIIAHPERYLYMDHKEYRKLKDRGCQLQLNLLSLAGHYGKEVKQRAIKLLEEGLYDLTGSDLHKLKVFKHGIERIELSKKQIKALLEVKEKASKAVLV